MTDNNQKSPEPKLTIEYVPKSCWFKNVRANVTAAQWDKIKTAVAEKAGWRCEICGGRGSRHPVECHEVWLYDDKTLTQKLVRLIALCPRCHEVKHIGLTKKRGNLAQALAHMAAVNQWHITRAEFYRKNVMTIWKRRSFYQWKLDLSYLRETFGIHVPDKKPSDLGKQ